MLRLLFLWSVHVVEGGVASWSCETRLVASLVYISNLRAELLRLQALLAASTTGCRSPEDEDAETRELVDDAPAVDNAHWNVVFGACERNGDCISSPHFPAVHNSSETCIIEIGSGWTGVLDVHVFGASSDDWFTVDGVMHRVEDVRGLTPSTSILWEGTGSGTDPGWVLCHRSVAAHSPSGTFWLVSGLCEVDGDGCVTSPHFPNAVTFPHACTLSVHADWTGYIHVEHFSTDDAAYLVVNGRGYDGSLYHVRQQGLEGIEPTNEITWSSEGLDEGKGWKICRRPPNDAVPWYGGQWTCISDGLPCLKDSLHSGVCATQESDKDDYDSDGNIHNGYPWCSTEAQAHHTCGPCRCAAGQNQSYYKFSLPGQRSQTYITCAVCPSGMFNAIAGETCRSCDVGKAQQYEGGTSCHSCGSGRFSAVEGLSLCIGCSSGKFKSSDTACTSCDPGRFQNQSAQSSCHKCSDILDSVGATTELWDTMELTADGRWHSVSGADDVRFCGCRKRAWFSESGTCSPCTEGMICKGMGLVELKPGYFSTPGTPGFVWQCYGRDSGRCPGGPPGSCARNRNNGSIACGECEPHTRGTTEGHCEPCTSNDTGWVMGALLLVLLVLVCVYCAVVTENRANRKKSVTLLATLCSHAVSTLQMLDIFDLLSVAWPPSFARILRLGALLNFKLDLLNVSCLSPMSALTEYVGIVFGFLVLMLMMVAIHVCYTLWLLFHRSASGRKGQERCISGLVGAVGTVFLAAFISVSAAIFTPFRCERHPNGELTLHSFSQIVCWNDEYGPDHRNMVIVGAFASLLPLGFVSVCAWVVASLPARMRQGDTAFLHTHAFLFYRFRPAAYWYALVVLSRSLCMALVPTVLDEALQVLLLTVSLLLYVVLATAVRPWAAREANYVDIATNIGFVLVLVLAAMSTDYADEKFVGSLLLVVFFSFMSLFVGVAVYGVCHVCMQHRGKTYQFFLCHHKDGGGAFARILKVRLLSHPRVTRQVFLDSDNLRDLKVLFGVVGNETRTLVVLCTREILFRAWCVGEMTTARLHGVDTILVLFPDFEWPSNDFVTSYAEFVHEVTSLTEYGISESLVQTTLQWLPSLPLILLPQTMSLACVDAVVGKLLSRSRSTGRHEMRDQRLEHQVPQLRDETQDSEVVVIVDHTNWNAVCAAVVVELLLKEHFPMLAFARPQDDLPDITKTVLVLCSNGCFYRPVFVKQLFQARALGVGVIPIVAETNFQFPTTAWYQELTDASSHLAHSSTDLISLVKRIFEEIVVHIQVQDSEHALHVRGEAIARRLSCGSLRPFHDDADRPSKPHSSGSSTPPSRSAEVNSDICDHSVTADLESITLEFSEPCGIGSPCTDPQVEERTDTQEDKELTQQFNRWLLGDVFGTDVDDDKARLSVYQCEDESTPSGLLGRHVFCFPVCGLISQGEQT